MRVLITRAVLVPGGASSFSFLQWTRRDHGLPRLTCPAGSIRYGARPDQPLREVLLQAGAVRFKPKQRQRDRGAPLSEVRPRELFLPPLNVRV